VFAAPHTSTLDASSDCPDYIRRDHRLVHGEHLVLVADLAF
jgi:hypothetical protein